MAIRSALGSTRTESVASTTGRTRVGGVSDAISGGASRVRATRRV